MAKAGVRYAKIQPILNTVSQNSGWALCVGAGISLPAFPEWTQLVQSLFLTNHLVAEPEATAQRLLASFSPDAVIQATQELLQQDDLTFAKTLADALYERLKKKLDDSEYEVLAKCLFAHSGDFPREYWSRFLNIIRTHFPSMTALQLAIVVNEVLETDLRPSAILSFNAEPSFPALINAIYREGLAGKAAPSNRAASGKKIVDRVTHSISTRRQGRLPVFFCHGLLPVSGKRGRRIDQHSIDKLVFSESEYLQLSNNAFSWQSSAFIDVCVSHSVVFIGVSLSDSDMRKWLSWIHNNRLAEIHGRQADAGPSTSHYWIRTLPAVESDVPLIEAAVSHLGVRLVWIDSWSQSADALRRLLGI